MTTQTLIWGTQRERAAHADLEAWLSRAQLSTYSGRADRWEIPQSSRKLGYLTHGVFRYFGKFPPPVADRLIGEYTGPGDLVIDPTAGSGTTLVEAGRLGRPSFGMDINPLSVLISKVKTTPQPSDPAMKAARAVAVTAGETWERYGPSDWPQMRGFDHWFWPETASRLVALRRAIYDGDFAEQIRDLLLVAFAATVRRYSRASHGLPRAFLDPAKTESSQVGVCTSFETIAAKIAGAVSELLHVPQFSPAMVVLGDSKKDLPVRGGQLAIVHPPYFNVYRYSSIYRFETAWLELNVDPGELREGYKRGDPTLLADYVEDLVALVMSSARAIVPTAPLALMMGDTTIRGEHIPTTSTVLSKLDSRGLGVQRLFVREPKHTEASYLTAQRRETSDLGPRFSDFVAILHWKT